MVRLRHWSLRTAAAVLGCTGALWWTGCATHADKILPASQQATVGNYEGAVAALNGVLRVDSASELPRKWGANRALAALDRAVLLQALGRYEDAARDMSAAEERIELIDLTKDPVGSLAKYLYSDSARAYRAPPSERLALNAVNLLNYLARGDLDGAAVEARRFQTMREFLDSESIDDHGVVPFGAYLAGFVFEHLGEGDRALRYYDDALEAGPLPSLARPAARLARAFPYRGTHLEGLISTAAGPGQAAHDAELLVVLSLGRVSHKVAERIPLGAAVGIAGTYLSGDTDWLKYGATKVVVYPELVYAPSTLGAPSVVVDGRDVSLDLLVDLEEVVRAEYDQLKPQIIAAAITRMAARAAVAEGLRAAGKQESNVLGDVLAIAIEGALVGADRPDTRSWIMMPGRILAARVPVSAGDHEVEVRFDYAPEATRRSTIRVDTGGYRAIVVTEPR